MQFASKTDKTSNQAARGIVADTPPVLSGLYDQAKAAGEVRCGWLYTNALPTPLRSEISESIVISLAVPDEIEVDWASQTEDWLIPHNEINYVNKQSTCLMLLGNGPLALEMGLASLAFFGTEGSIYVLYVCAAETRIVRYSWNERLLATVDALYKTAGPNYLHDKEEAERAIAIGLPIHGCNAVAATLPTGYFAIERDGSLIDYRPSQRLRG